MINEMYGLSAAITAVGLYIYGKRAYKEFFGFRAHEIGGITKKVVLIRNQGALK